MKHIRIIVLLALSICTSLSACSPKVGTDKWCEQIKGKAENELSMQNKQDFAQYCLEREMDKALKNTK
jgi:hypothetical protein